MYLCAALQLQELQSLLGHVCWLHMYVSSCACLVSWFLYACTNIMILLQSERVLYSGLQQPRACFHPFSVWLVHFHLGACSWLLKPCLHIGWSCDGICGPSQSCDGMRGSSLWCDGICGSKSLMRWRMRFRLVM